jgi:hypothetical protein
MRRAAAIALCLVASGCLHGQIYTNVTEPLTTHFRDTPVVTNGYEKGDVKQLRYSYFHLIWDDNAIGSLAKRAGFEKVYYADLQTISILGIWTQYRARVRREVRREGSFRALSTKPTQQEIVAARLRLRERFLAKMEATPGRATRSRWAAVRPTATACRASPSARLRPRPASGRCSISARSPT